MTQSKSSFDDRMMRNATWTAALLAAAGLALFGFAISTVTFTDWEDYILAGFPLVLTGASLASIYIMRRGKLLLGSGIIFVLNLIVPLLIILIIKDTLWTALFYTAVSSALIIWRSLPYQSWRWSIITAVAVLALIVVIDLIIAPPDRFANPPAFNTFIVVLILILSAAFIIQAVRQTWGRSMRNKLMVALIGVTTVATGVLAVYVYNSTTNILQNSLESELNQHMDGVSVSVSNLIHEQVVKLTTLALDDILQQTIEESNDAYSGSTAAIQAELEAKDVQWRAADAADNDKDPLVQEHLTNDVALDLIEFQNTFPENSEVFITDVYGGLAGTTNRTSDYYQADEDWWQAAYDNGRGAVYISNPEFDESTGQTALLIAVPVRSRLTGEVIGILRTTYDINEINVILTEKLGQTDETDMLFPGENLLHFHEGQFAPIDIEEFTQLQSLSGQGMTNMEYEGTSSVVLSVPVRSAEGNQWADQLGWVLLFHQQQDEALAPLNTQVRGTLFTMGIVIVLAILVAFAVSIVLVRPITQLTQTAEEIAAGNLNSRAKVATTDEIGTLASTFNSMTSQLQEILQGLEERVAARTRDLAIVAEVGTATATILESKRLLQEVVDLTKERFNLYHSHIYLLDEKGENLVLAAGAGEPGRVMVAEGRSIPLGREQSLVARAARERQGVTVNDVTQEPDHLPNPLLPDTRSELAVPMIVGGNVLGVFDIQSEQVGRFTDTDVNIQTTLAAQLATSIQNVRSFERSKKEAELQSLVNLIGSRIQRAASIEETLQTAIRELGAAVGASRVKASLKPASNGGEQARTVVPAEPKETLES